MLTGLARGSPAENSGRERGRAACPLLAFMENLSSPLPPLRLEGDRVPIVAVFDHEDPTGFSFVLPGGCAVGGGVGTRSVSRGLFSLDIGAAHRPRGSPQGAAWPRPRERLSGLSMDIPHFFSLVGCFFFYSFGFCSGVFSCPEGAELRPRQDPSYAGNAPLWDTELMSHFTVP